MLKGIVAGSVSTIGLVLVAIKIKEDCKLQKIKNAFHKDCSTEFDNSKDDTPDIGEHDVETRKVQ